jgi:Mg-chelatase subunit ChlD
MYDKKKADPPSSSTMMDYPVAVATHIVDAPASSADQRQQQQQQQHRPTGLLQKGRSHRVVVPPQHATSSKRLSDHEVAALQAQGYTSGLIRSISRNNQTFPLRIWVVDNSGSMATGDGHRLVETPDRRDVRYVGCSRWAEIQETVEYHARMAALLGAPTVFRLLNDPGRMAGPQQFGIGERGVDFAAEDLNVALSTIRNASPSGVTPLADHVREIRDNVLSMRDELVSNGQKVVVVLATDGLPSDPYGNTSYASRQEFQDALRSLEGLPVWVVVRLCTDEDDVVDFYNNLDSQLELSLEVIDDFSGEAQEVHQHNRWLNYSLPLHRIREMGFSHKLLDLLDERQLSVDELRDFFFLLFGPENFDGVPDPQLDWKGFSDHLAVILKKEKNQWNPMTKKMAPWIDLKILNKTYTKGICAVM